MGKRNCGCGNCCFFTWEIGNTNGAKFCYHPKNTFKKFDTYSGQLETEIKNQTIELKWNKNGYCKKFIQKKETENAKTQKSEKE